MAINNGAGNIRTKFRENISPKMTGFYTRFGFANRDILANRLRELHLENHDQILNTLVSKGIIKERFARNLSSLNDVEGYMLAGSVTRRQVESVAEQINYVSVSERMAGITESLEEALGGITRSEAILQAMNGTPFTVDGIFTRSTLNVAAALDRIFPNASGIHSKMAQGVSSAFNFQTVGELNGRYRLGFLGAISLGVIAMVASPFLLSAIGSFLCTTGFAAAAGLKIAGGALAGLGTLARIAKRYQHVESNHWYVRAFTSLGRNKFLERYAFPLGAATLFTGFTFGTSVSNTFVLGKFLLENSTLLSGLTLGIPGASIIGSLIYYFVGTRNAIRANSGQPAPHGDEAARIRDIKKTHAYSGTAFVFSLTYFAYRFIATSLFVTAAFSPISAGMVALTGVSALLGYTGGYILPNLLSKYRSPWIGFLTGTLGSVALPMVTGAIAGDFGSIKDSVSAAASLGVFAQDIHSTSHGAAFHNAQTSALYPDRLAPVMNMGEKKKLAGFFGRVGKAITSFWEKAHVTPPDVVFSAFTSAIFDENAYLKQCVMQCDLYNRGKGMNAANVHKIVKISEESQQVVDELYAKCRAKMEAFDPDAKDPTAINNDYRKLIDLLCDLATYFSKDIPEKIKLMCDDYEQKWKGIYDVSCAMSLDKARFFTLWAKKLAERLANNDQLTKEEVKNVLLYLCERFDKEFILCLRKDSNEYVMRVQKNENQSGSREFIGNTGYEITRFDSRTGLGSIERILSSHIRRRNMHWEHNNKSEKYEWLHRQDVRLEEDPKSVREYREKVRSHSKDLDFVINDHKGRPLALQTREGSILLIEENLSAELTLVTADGRIVKVNQSGGVFTATDNNGKAVAVETIKSYNARHDNKIYLIADPAKPKDPAKIEDIPAAAHNYYRDTQKRPLFIYAIDPHDYEFNLDSEFVNDRIAMEYVPIFERDRSNKYASVSYRKRRQISLDYGPSGLDHTRTGLPRSGSDFLLPSNIELNWSPMYMMVETLDGKKYVVPYLEEKNGQVEPKVEIKKAAVSWKTFQKQYLANFTNANFLPVKVTVKSPTEGEIKFEFPPGLPFDTDPKSADDLSRAVETKLIKKSRDEKFEIKKILKSGTKTIDWETFKKEYLIHDIKINAVLKVDTRHEYQINSGINGISFELPAHLFVVNGEIVKPNSAEQLLELVKRCNKPLDFIIPQTRVYNWRNIKRTDIVFPVDIEIKKRNPKPDEDATSKQTIYVPLSADDLASGKDIIGLVRGSAKSKIAELKIKDKNIENITIRSIKNQREIHFVYDTENGTEVSAKVPQHQSHPGIYSIHFPPLSQIKSIRTEVFRKSVGTLPYARYTYRLPTLEKAEELGYAKVKKDKVSKAVVYDTKTGWPVMESGCQIWEKRDAEGNITGYEFQRFGRPESIFELGAFDPNSVDTSTIKIVASSSGPRLTFEALEWSTKLYPVNPDVMDLGTEDNPKARIKGVITGRSNMKKIFGSGSVLWSKQTDASGKVSYKRISLGKKLKDVRSIIDVSLIGKTINSLNIEITRKEKYGDLTFADPALTTETMWYPPEWVEKVEFGDLTAEGREVRILYKNPHTDLPLAGERRTQSIRLKDRRLRVTDNYHGTTIEERDIYDKDTGERKLVPYLKMTRVNKETIRIRNTNVTSEVIETGKLSIITPRSALQLEMKDGSEYLLPLNDRIDGKDYIFDEGRATAEEKDQLAVKNNKLAHHLPHFEDGKVGLIIGPQLSISGRNWFGYARSGIPYCALDQSIFMAYDLNSGLGYGREPYADGVVGGAIQPAKSRSGDGRIREGTTVQNGTPVGRPLRKTLASGEEWNEVELLEPFFSFAPMPATITEDYREGKGIYKKHGHAAVFFNRVVAIGAGVEDMSQILTQRRRWPTSVPIGQYWFFRDLLDELVRAKIARIIPGMKTQPSHYTWGQLIHEWNGVTWYYCGLAEYLRSFAPLGFYLGITAYPVDPVAFPLVWLGAFASSMKSHNYSMKKVGNHWLESMYWGQVAYKTLVPNFIEMLAPQPGRPVRQGNLRHDPFRRIAELTEELATPRLAKECLGQFGVTALSGGGKLDDRYLRQIRDDIALKAAAFGRGLLEMGNISRVIELQANFGPDIFSQATIYFAIAMNTIWPYYDMILNRGALKLAKNGAKGDPNYPDKTRFFLNARMIEGKLHRHPHPIRRNRMQYTLGITDWPKSFKGQARYIQDLSAEELREIFRYMPNTAGPMLEKMLDEKYLVPAKIATIIEAMVYDEKVVEEKKRIYFLDKSTKDPRQPLASLSAQSEREARAEARLAMGMAIHILSKFKPNNRKAVLDSMQKDKRDIITAIIGTI